MGEVNVHRARIETFEYFNHFTLNDEFRDKRFSRYIDKVKAKLCEYLSIMLNKSANELEDYMVNFFINFYKMEEPPKKNSFFYLITEYNVVNFDYMIFQKEDIQNILNTKEFRITITNEIANCCVDWIRQEGIRRGNINLTNYFLTVPNTNYECIMFFELLVNRIYISAERMFKSNITNSYADIIKDEVVLSLDEQLNDLEKEKESVNNIVKEKDNKINTLKKTIEYYEEQSKKVNEIYNESNEDLLRQLNKLEKKYNKLVDKINSIQKDDIDDIVEERLEFSVDYNLKYCFVMGKENSIESNILKKFPNSIIISENDNLSSDIDLVIFMTSYMGHSLYYGIKNQCKAKNLKYIHCNVFNIEQIESLIGVMMNE